MSSSSCTIEGRSRLRNLRVTRYPIRTSPSTPSALSRRLVEEAVRCPDLLRFPRSTRRAGDSTAPISHSAINCVRSQRYPGRSLVIVYRPFARNPFSFFLYRFEDADVGVRYRKRRPIRFSLDASVEIDPKAVGYNKEGLNAIKDSADPLSAVHRLFQDEPSTKMEDGSGKEVGP